MDATTASIVSIIASYLISSTSVSGWYENGYGNRSEFPIAWMISRALM